MVHEVLVPRDRLQGEFGKLTDQALKVPLKLRLTPHEIDKTEVQGLLHIDVPGEEIVFVEFLCAHDPGEKTRAPSSGVSPIFL